jgi:hypothetical protein
MQMQVLRIILLISIKAALDGKLERDAERERNRAAIVEELTRKLRGGQPDDVAPEA